MAGNNNPDDWEEADPVKSRRRACRIRRLVIRDTNGEVILADAYGNPLVHWEIDLTAVPNASAAHPITAVVQEQCNLGDFHDGPVVELPCWGAD